MYGVLMHLQQATLSQVAGQSLLSPHKSLMVVGTLEILDTLFWQSIRNPLFCCCADHGGFLDMYLVVYLTRTDFWLKVCPYDHL